MSLLCNFRKIRTAITFFCEKGDDYAKYKDHYYQKGKDLQTFSMQKIAKERLHCKGKITLKRRDYPVVKRLHCRGEITL